MSRGRKPFSTQITNNWEKAFFNSIGYYINLINNGLSKSFRTEPLSNHIKVVGGFAFKNSEYKNLGVPIIRISDFNNERIVLDNVVYYDESCLLEKYELKESDIIIALTGGTIGKLGIVQADLGKLYLNQRVGKFEIIHPEEFEKEYIYWIARGVEEHVKKLAWGAAIPNVSPKQIEQLNFPIPTKDVQKKIICFLNDLKNASIEDKEYFTLDVETQILETQNKHVKALEIQDELSYQLTQLENLNQAILLEAVQGKLVKQDPKDESTSELLKRIKAEKANLGKKSNPMPCIKAEEIPFEIPGSSLWCRLGEITNLITSGSRDWAKFYSSKGDVFVRMGNLSKKSFELRMDKIQYISPPKTQEGKRTKLQENDILVSITGEVGNLGLIPKGFGTAYINQHTALVRLNNQICTKFIAYIFLSKTLQKQFNAPQRGMKNSFRLSDVGSLLIPLPPYLEQQRIVVEIEKQFYKTKQLKADITANQEATDQLLKALLQQVFEVKIETEKVDKQLKVVSLKSANIDFDKIGVLAAEIVYQLHGEQTFGHLKLQKLIYLCQKTTDMQLSTNFLKQAMGPYDPKLMRSLDTALKENNWFEYNQSEILKYKALKNAGSHRHDFDLYFAEEKKQIQFLIDNFKSLKSEIIEIVATLYACLELIIQEKSIYSESLLIKRFYEWSNEKGKFSEKQIKKVFKRMIEIGIIPDSFNIPKRQGI